MQSIFRPAGNTFQEHVIVKIPIKKRRSFVKINMMEQKLRLIDCKQSIPDLLNDFQTTSS